MRKIQVVTLFPEMFTGVLNNSMMWKAQKEKLVEFRLINLRDFGLGLRRRVDDTPYSERQGMLMQAEPIFRCFNSVTEGQQKPHTIYMSPQGKTLTQQKAKELSELSSIFILCGHYEGVDERVIRKIADEEISIGDYVLTGGELPALVLIDTVVRMLDGVLSKADCYEDESHFNGLLEYPQYTRPEVWEGIEVPKILLSGHHANIKKWRHEKSLENTYFKRPDLLKYEELTSEDKIFIEKLKKNEN